ncbi:FAD:protein FMN transferase [Methylosarcina fibrata]|uniref:FAD:protein FMN transferase n=1 Tax=Methylosarcina fibrata TaxID=105972 RepID=UPI00036232C2|nr:FAD:protein FMN transferase [Methylosarcina fibrata]
MKNLTYYRREFKAMGTPCDIQLFARDEAKARQAADAVIADVQRLESLYSRYETDSFLSEINRVAAIGGSIGVDDETACLLDYAVTCYEQSGGLFDITASILRHAWNFDQNILPEQSLIDKLLDKVGWHKVIWKRPVLTFSVPGMEIDFGGIVKEYAVDRAASLCYGLGIRHGMVNLGGDIKVIGPRVDGRPWRIGIRHPRSREALLGTLWLYKGALASSGDYERCILVNGVRYGHVLNPKTGWPVRYLTAVSVVGEFCVVAGSASTIARLKELQGPDWLEELGLPHLWVDVHSVLAGSITAKSVDSIVWRK